MILHTQPRKAWNAYDFLLLEAFAIYEAEKCSQCGYPVWICHNEDEAYRIEFDLVDDVCYAKREIDMVNEANSQSKTYKAPAGIQQRPVAKSWTGLPLDDAMRTAYYETKYPSVISD
ncbi:hypothetical protein [Frigoribacterium sp. UYMn621]|uniref:hypothetical protein n=1 Tax=Frigoribacterium sp. UYMn621 TaxID=3156343 RepID=UPI00339B615B